MAVSLHVQQRAGGETVSAGSTVYIPFLTNTEGGVEANSHVPIRDAGDLTKAFGYVSANDLSGTCTFKIRKSGSDGNGTLTYTSAEEGRKEDGSGTDSYANTDTGYWRQTTAAGTGSITTKTLGFAYAPDAPGDCLSFLATFGPSSSNQPNASTTRFFPLNGDRSGDTTEARATFPIQVPGTLKDFYAQSGANNWTGTVTLGARVNGVDKLTVTFTTGEEGRKENSGSESIAADDEVCWFDRTDGGSGTWNLEYEGATFVNTSSKFLLISQRPNGSLESGDAHYPVAGDQFGFSVEAEAQIQALFDFTVAELYGRVVANTGNVNGSTLYGRKNGSNTALRIRVNGGTGELRDVEDKIDLVASSADTLGLFLDNYGGNITFEAIGIVGDSTGGGGGGTPPAVAFDRDAEQELGSVGASVWTSPRFEPGKENPSCVGLVIVQNGSGSADDVSAVSYKGSALSRPTTGIAQRTAGEQGAVYVYFLGENVPLEGGTFEITHGGNGTKHAYAFSLKGDKNVVEADSDAVSGLGSDPSVPLDSGADDAIRVGGLFSGLGNPAFFNVGTELTQIGAKVDFGAQTGGAAIETTKSSGSTTFGYTMSSDDYALVAAALAEAAGETPVSRTDTCGFEALASPAASHLAPFEAQLGLTRSSAPAFESLAGVALETVGRFESLQGVSRGDVAPIEALGRVARSDAPPWESAGTLRVTTSPPFESLLELAQETLAPFESGLAVAVETTAPLEALAGVLRATAAPWEAAGTLQVLTVAPFESAGTVVRSDVAAFESLQELAAESIGAYEALGGVRALTSSPWEAAGTIVVATVSPYETVTSLAASLEAAYESLAGVVRTDAPPFEALARVALELAAPYEAKGTVSVAVVLPYEARSSTAHRFVVAVIDLEPRVTATPSIEPRVSATPSVEPTVTGVPSIDEE